jgi:hypothetical protein
MSAAARYTLILLIALAVAAVFHGVFWLLWKYARHLV